MCLILVILAPVWPMHTTRADVSVSTRSEVQALLDVRSAAVRARDKGAFLTTVDPRAADFSAAQQLWFDRAAVVPLQSYALRLDLDEAPEFTRKRDLQKHGSQALVALVEERFQIQGFDDHPSLNTLFFTFTRDGNRWVISSDSDLEDLGLFSSRQPWDFGPVNLETSEHFMLITHPADSGSASTLLARAEAALPGVERSWTTPWPKRVILFVPGSQRELEKILDATFDVSNFVAVAVSTLDLDEGWHPVTRVIVNPTNFLKRTPEAQTTILTHELVHVATRPASGPFLTSLVEEGIAQLAESDRTETAFLTTRSPLRSNFDGSLPEDSDFFTGGGASIRRSYAEALSAISYIFDRYGLEKLGAFYKALGAARIEPGTTRYHLDRSLRSTLGVSLVDFERQWAAAVRG